MMNLIHISNRLAAGCGRALLAAVLVAVSLQSMALAQVVINEVDYDQPSTDTAEFVELKNIGASAVDLSAFTLQFVNGANNSVYQTFPLPAVMLAPGGYFVLCADAAQTANCDLDVSPDSNLIQNGDPDAVALLENGVLVDALSYGGDVPGFVEGSGAGLDDDPGIDLFGLSRFPDGADTNQNNVDFSGRCISPGASNVAESSDCASLGPPVLVINEIDYDQPGTDAAEFVEIKNAGTSAVDLSSYTLTFINGNAGGSASYADITLPAVMLAAGDYFVVCANAATVAECDLDGSPDTNFIQNGAPDAVALTLGGSIVDAVSYEGDTAGGFTEGSGVGLEDSGADDQVGISRIVDGQDTDQNNLDFSPRCITPGSANTAQTEGCGAAPTLVINEIDYDQPSTDTAEFVEIKNTGPSPVGLLGITLELVNGNGGTVYNTINLPDVTLAAGGYFVVCGDASTVFACDLVESPSSNLIQNGAPDAVALRFGSALLDTVSYEGDTVAPYTEGSGAGLIDSGSGDFEGLSRFPDGVDTDQNDVDFSLRCITPGAANIADSSGCTAPGPDRLIINEIDYDQAGTDAAEFIELKNAGSRPLDLGNYTLELVNGSGATVYRTIALPAMMLNAGGYFVVCGDAANVHNCDLDAGPDTNFIQNGSPDAAALIRDGMVVDALSYAGDTAAPYIEGSGAGLIDDPNIDFAGLSRIPDGVDTDQNNIDFSFRCITPGLGNTVETTDCGPLGPTKEIFAIQGSGLASPFAGQSLTSVDNVVTCVTAEGFFMQTPTSRSDNDPQTSDGIFVFTDNPPGVSIGDQVSVSGAIQEFNDSTEFSGNPQVEVTGTAALPPAFPFDAFTPSPDQPRPANEIERFEGMRIHVADGVTTGGADQFGDSAIVAKPDRAFREPGIVFPGLPGLPVWDGNPEVFELNPDGGGLPNDPLSSPTHLTATGCLAFSFGDYQFVPTSLDILEAPTLPRAVRFEEEGEFTVGSLNAERLFNDIDDEAGTPEDANFPMRAAKFARYIVELMHSPDILAMEEVENIAVLQSLANEVALLDPSVFYTPYLVEGNDVGGIDVGFLVRDTVSVDAVTQLGKNTIFSFDGSLLNDRPPLLLEGQYMGGPTPFPIAALVVHQRSLNNIEDPVDGERVKRKRLEQAQFVADEVQTLQSADPDIRLVVLGDFNAFQFTDGYADVLGVITGNLDPLGAEFPGTDVVNPDLTNQILSLPQEERYSFIFGGSAQVLDHMLTSEALNPFVSGIEIPRADSDSPDFFSLHIDPTTPLRASDHDGVVLFIQTQPPSRIENAVALATNSIWLLDKAKVQSGDLIVNQPSSGLPLGLHQELTVGFQAQTASGYSLKADRIKVRHGATVASDVFYNQLDNDGTITGSQSTPLDLPVFDQLPPFIAGSPGSHNITVNFHQNLVLPAGSYRKIQVRSGGTLTMTGGVYDVRSIELGLGAKILFEAPSEVRVAERVESIYDVAIKPANSGVAASDIVFYVAGSDLSIFGISLIKAVTIGIDSVLEANVYAPNGTIAILSGDVRGALIARNVILGVKATAVLDSAFGD